MSKHCAPCFRGKRSQVVSPKMKCGVIDLGPAPDRAKFAYICGVSRGNKYASNFHLALAPALDHARAETFNGYVFSVYGAARIPITGLPAGWRGLGDAFTTCRNFQFAAQIEKDFC